MLAIGADEVASRLEDTAYTGAVRAVFRAPSVSLASRSGASPYRLFKTGKFYNELLVPGAASHTKHKLLLGKEF